jgi:uncharacterized protein
MPKNAICHFEIAVKDAKKAAAYYEKLFGWKMNYDMGDDYVLFQPAEGVGGAFSKTNEHAAASGITIDVHVDSIEDFLKKAVHLGGREIKPKSAIPGIGWFGLLADPDGNIIGLFTPKPHS